MDYIRDYCKLIIFDILKIRVDLLSEDFYNTIKEIILELYSIFNNYDKLVKNNVLLYNPTFTIKKKKAFNEFYTRFLVTITLLDYSENYKIAILRRLITLKLRLRIADISSSSFRLVIEHLRKTN